MNCCHFKLNQYDLLVNTGQIPDLIGLNKVHSVSIGINCNLSIILNTNM